jgi:hypothetical protein
MAAFWSAYDLGFKWYGCGSQSLLARGKRFRQWVLGHWEGRTYRGAYDSPRGGRQGVIRMKTLIDPRSFGAVGGGSTSPTRSTAEAAAASFLAPWKQQGADLPAAARDQGRRPGHPLSAGAPKNPPWSSENGLALNPNPSKALKSARSRYGPLEDAPIRSKTLRRIF